MNKVKSFEQYILEGEDSTTKPMGADESPEDISNDDATSNFDKIKEKVGGSIDSLKSLQKHLTGTKIPTKKIDNIIADLKEYLQSVEEEFDISNKSNQEKQD